MENAEDDISTVRAAVKLILRDGRVTQEEAEKLKVSASTLRNVANRVLSAATYLEKREACAEEVSSSDG